VRAPGCECLLLPRLGGSAGPQDGQKGAGLLGGTRARTCAEPAERLREASRRLLARHCRPARAKRLPKTAAAP
jgi:hypothetical protein